MFRLRVGRIFRNVYTDLSNYMTSCVARRLSSRSRYDQCWDAVNTVMREDSNQLLAQFVSSPVSDARRCHAVPAGTRWALTTANLFLQSDVDFAVLMSHVCLPPCSWRLQVLPKLLYRSATLHSLHPSIQHFHRSHSPAITPWTLAGSGQPQASDAFTSNE